MKSMNFTVLKEHRDFFRKHHWIECQGILTNDELKHLDEGLTTVSKERAGSASTLTFSKTSIQNNFETGHDMWRGLPAVKKIVLSRSLAGVASELIEQRPLRFGYDTLFPAVSKNGTSETIYANILKTTPTLSQMSCIQGVLCGAMLCVGSESNIQSDAETQTTLFSRTPGNGVFFSPDWELPLHEIYNNPGFTYLLVVYAKQNAVYLAQQGDPHLHDFKRLGYNFGDRLKEPYHPIVYA